MRAYERGMYVLGGAEEHANATPVRVVGHDIPIWQNIAILVGALASCATLYSVWRREIRR